MSEVFLRTASALSLRTLPEGALSNLLAPIQLGLGSPAGAEAVIHKVQTLLELHPGHVLLSLDFANGFNSMFRHVMLERLYALPELSPLWRIADLGYGVPSPLHLFNRDELVASLTSQRGSRQGCVLGTLLFCLGLQPILEDAARGLPDLNVSAYIDDIAAVGPLDQVDIFFRRLVESAPTLGLALSLPKSSLLWSSPSSQPVPDAIREWANHRSIPLVCGAVPLLGSMVGQDPVLRQRFAADKVAALAPFFSALAHPRFTAQAAFILLRVCALPKFNFLCRTLPPRLTSAACAAFDKSVLNAAVSILHLERDSLSALVLQLLAFPTSYGGFGLRRMELAAPAAFLGSLAAAARYMPSQNY